MKFKDLFQDVEEWFWKLEFNPELNVYELYLGIPNDWVFAKKNEGVTIELIHELEENSIIKISYANDEELSIDDVIDCSKLLVLKNKELEKRKEEHRIEMENLKNLLIEKEKSFLEYVDKVKDDGVNDGVNEGIKALTGLTEQEKETVNDAVKDAVSEAAKQVVEEAMDASGAKGKDFMEDIEKLKLK